jgi:hypothetical protein
VRKIQVTTPTDYGVEYFSVEREDDRYGFSVPAWEEIGLSELCGPFSTREEAYRSISNLLECLPHYGLVAA